MPTFNSIFPTFLTQCGGLHTLLLSVAFVLFIVGVIATVQQRASHRTILNLLLRLLILTSLLVYLPAWGNTLQSLLQNSVLSGLGIDPSQVYQQYNQLLIIKRDPSTQSSWWNVMSQVGGFTTDLIVSAVLLLVGQLASLMMFWGYIFQAVILNLGYALSPLLIGFMAIPALKPTGNRYLMSLVGVLYGLVLGIGLSLVLVYVINRQSFSWSVDLSIPWLQAAAFSLGLIAAAAATATLSGRAAMSVEALRAVREDW